jgi:hypothetical protein
MEIGVVNLHQNPDAFGLHPGHERPRRGVAGELPDRYTLLSRENDLPISLSQVNVLEAENLTREMLGRDLTPPVIGSWRCLPPPCRKEFAGSPKFLAYPLLT